MKLTDESHDPEWMGAFWFGNGEKSWKEKGKGGRGSRYN